MNLKYYFRGLGIGVVVTALLLSFIGMDQDSGMSDEEVKKRAAELGMVESTILSNLDLENKSEKVSEEQSSDTDILNNEEKDSGLETENASEDVTESLSEQISGNSSETATEKASEADSEKNSEITSENNVSSESVSEQKSETEEIEEYIIITVNKGDGSGTVAKRVFDAGLVADAVAFDKYLCANGYDHRISTGNHEIPKGATEKEIAELLCTR